MRSPLIGRRVSVEVPATIANLGAGYDCLGLAVDLSLRVDVEVLPVSGSGDGPVDIEVEGEGAGEISAGRGNRFLEALWAGLREHRLERPLGVGWQVRMTSQVPLARGLGSSGAATIAGLLVADALANAPGATARSAGAEAAPPPSSRAGILDRATALEGHPDNVAPALLGGFVASLSTQSYRFDAPDALRIVLLVPELRLSTPRMRAILPESVPRADAVANLARVAVGVAGIASGDWSVLSSLTEDRLHEPYRATVYPHLPFLIAAARAAGAVGACLAGGGSTVAAFTLGSEADAAAIGQAMLAVAEAQELPAVIRTVRPRNEGARVLER